MGDVIGLEPRRTARDARLAAAAVRAIMHPALRWQVGADTAAAHRRTPLGRAVCGAAGALRLAERGTPLCGVCYPARWHLSAGHSA